MRQNRDFIRGALVGALSVILVISMVACGKMRGSESKSDVSDSSVKSASEASDPVNSEMETKLELLQALINANYQGEVDSEELEEGIYKGYIEALGDPYSAYYDEKETKELNESTSGEYSGIGAVMSQDLQTGVITITRVYQDSPAQEAGLKDNDILNTVNGEEVTGVDLTEVVSGIRGEEGTTVEISVLRGEDNEEVEVTATRRKIVAETVSYEMKEDQVGYIQVTEFDTVTEDQYKKALEELEAQGMERLIVDLRSNPGGSLATVVNMLDLMLPEGTVVSMKDKNGDETKYTSDDEEQFTKPLVVLVNGYSASASEIYSGAIQDFGTGTIVGTTTYGKGVVQQIFDLKDGTSVKLTIAEYFTPSGDSINGKGVVPDVEVEYEYDEENPDYDNQLEKAIEIVKEK